MMNELLSASYVSSFDISRTGDSIVYARNSRDGRSLHLLLRNTSATYDDHTVAAEDGTYESLMLTGDGRKLIYLRDNNGDEKFDIFTCRIEEHGGSFRLTDKINLTPDTDFSILRGISQDEAGRRIAFVSNRDGNFASYFLGTTDGKTKRISTHGYSDDAAVISPDGKKVAVSYGRYGQDSAITVYSTGDDSDSMELLHEGQPVDAGSPCRLGDSRHIAFSSNSGEFGRIGIMDTADGSLNWVSGTDEDLSHPVVATLSGVIACLREGGTDRVPAVLVPGLTNNTVSPDNLQGLCFDIRIDAGGKSLFMLMETASEPANLCMVETGSGKHYRLSHWLYAREAEWLEQRCEEQGIELRRVSPWKTSQFCRFCGKWDRRSRSGKVFMCVHCGHTDDADMNGAQNIRLPGLAGVYSLRSLPDEFIGNICL